jgi:eukaryotic-like serine/threonine-protein kinase
VGICVQLPERYSWKCRAGKGGMGEVHQALDRTTGELVAVKVLHARGVVEMARFRQEARLLAELSHPGIVRYFDHGVTPAGAPYIAMEWLEGETLEDRLDRGRIGPADAAHVAGLVLDALSAAHSHNIVHRDIKPGNIFLVGGKLTDVRVLDFGIARDRLDIKRFTRDGATVGTPLYTSPEQARGRGDVDGRADIFSLGCVLYEALAGDPPFTGETPIEVMTKACAGGAAELSAKCDGLPKALTSLVHAMILPERDKRPQSAAALGREFIAIARGLRGVVSAAAATESSGHRQGAEGGRHTTVAMLVVLGRGGQADESARLVEIRRLLGPLGCRMDRLVDRRLLMTADAPTAAEQAVRLATVALALRELEPTAKLALATGRASMVGSLPVGPLMDRLPTLLLGQDAGTIRLDEATQRLLPARFVVGKTQDYHYLVRGAAADSEWRPSAGKIPPPNVRPRRPSSLDTDPGTAPRPRSRRSSAGDG